MTLTAETCAALHAKCFTSPRPWAEAAFAAYLVDPLIVFQGDAFGFALGRVVVDEAELLTIAVDPKQRRAGTGSRLLGDFLKESQIRGAKTCFLEVAATNSPAIALYKTSGFEESGRRPGYYRQSDGTTVDALLFSKRL
ncbi:MAG: ribosomal protein S18-alanine N-acetyltransferase [Paracoccaceae bacterium]